MELYFKSQTELGKTSLSKNGRCYNNRVYVFFCVDEKVGSVDAGRCVFVRVAWRGADLVEYSAVKVPPIRTTDTTDPRQ